MFEIYYTKPGGVNIPNQKTLNVRIPINIMDEFKEKAYKKFHYEKGSIRMACIEALRDWCDKN